MLVGANVCAYVVPSGATQAPKRKHLTNLIQGKYEKYVDMGVLMCIWSIFVQFVQKLYKFHKKH